ncbi:undecaprenyl/decaprenyl-phosphate alpha-N-acetylglucosaminyl 1-phosphate transferase, partial [Phocaeicola vulgatus]|nr:undecaprenyl/decaprenyl-phosphate alpha-N-acetylglucosaminyl 1-phosphate transferase [Phocaeicola vulgatus]
KQRNAMIIIVSVSKIFILLNIVLSLYLNENWIVLGDILIWTLAIIRLTKSIGELQSEQITNK